MILNAMKEVAFSFTPNRAILEALIKYDFKIDEPRQNLMQLSFSSFANWPLFLVLALLWMNPTRSCCLPSVMSKLFGQESSVRYFLLDGQVSTMLIVCGIFFFLEWIFRKEFLLLILVFFFLSQSELHLHLALAAVIGVYLSRACYLWWLFIELESLTRKIWLWATSLQLVAVILTAVGSIVALEYYRRIGYFSSSLSGNRFEFLIHVVFFFQFLILLFLSLWGHFSYQKKIEPSFLPLHFSTTTWILRFKMSFLLKKKLKDKTAETLKSHMTSLRQWQEMKDQSPGVRLGHLEDVLKKELVYLQTSASRLTID